MTPTPDEIKAHIATLQSKIADLRETGTLRMSKTGVKWSISVHRDSIKRLRTWLRELSQVQAL